MRKHRKCYSKRGVSRNHLPCLEMPILVVKSHKKVKETITAVWSYWRAEDKEVIIWIPAYEIGGSSRVLATFCSHLLIFFPCKYLTFHFTVSKLSNNDKAESHSPKPKVWTKALFRSNFFMLITRPWKAGRLGRLPICSVPRWHLWLRGVAVLYLGTEAWRHHTKQKFCWYCHAHRVQSAGTQPTGPWPSERYHPSPHGKNSSTLEGIVEWSFFHGDLFRNCRFWNRQGLSCPIRFFCAVCKLAHLSLCLHPLVEPNSSPGSLNSVLQLGSWPRFTRQTSGNTYIYMWMHIASGTLSDAFHLTCQHRVDRIYYFPSTLKPIIFCTSH